MTEHISDQLDIASNLTSLMTDKAIKQASINANKLEVEATGRCLNCDEPLQDGKRWCNKSCLDDFERNKR